LQHQVAIEARESIRPFIVVQLGA